MKILVTTKRVPSTDVSVRVLPDGTGIDDEDTAYVINPFDAIALEEALLVRESGAVGDDVTVTALTLGGDESDDVLRTALAMGADVAVRVGYAGATDPLAVARVVEAVVRRDGYDLVLMGKQAVDDDANQVGQMLAGLLAWPQATFASEVAFEEGGKRLRVARETDRGIETVRVPLPAVVTADLRLNEPRYASLPALMKAKRRPIEVVEPADLGVAVEPRTRVLKLEAVSAERDCQMVEDAGELVRRLRSEAKVI